MVLKLFKCVNLDLFETRPIRGVNAMAAGAGPAHAMYFTCLEYGKTAAERTTFIPPSVADGKTIFFPWNTQVLITNTVGDLNTGHTNTELFYVRYSNGSVIR